MYCRQRRIVPETITERTFIDDSVASMSWHRTNDMSAFFEQSGAVTRLRTGIVRSPVARCCIHRRAGSHWPIQILRPVGIGRTSVFFLSLCLFRLHNFRQHASGDAGGGFLQSCLAGNLLRQIHSQRHVSISRQYFSGFTIRSLQFQPSFDGN